MTSPVLIVEDRLLSTDEIVNTLEQMFRRMEMIDVLCGQNFPLYSSGENSDWSVSPGGSWMGGFWAACWWLRAKMTGSAGDRQKAGEISQRLFRKLTADSGYRSLIFWYGAALGEIWLQDAPARELTHSSIAALAHSFDPRLNCIPLGTAMGGLATGSCAISVDNFASLIQLLCFSREKQYHRIAQCHAETLLAACRGDKGAFHAEASFDGHEFQVKDRAGVWSRGQAWAMLGLSRAAAQWGEPYLSQARAACTYWRDVHKGNLPRNRLDQAEDVKDPSAVVIASLAMLSLARLLPDETSWCKYAHQQISTVLHSPYFTVIDPDSASGSIGLFQGCCYRTRQNREEIVESVWGNFFLVAALAVLAGLIDPYDC
ncbi:glucuronyl hydrolase [Nitrosomonas europaea]|uniref:glucuronyl hydrolase n=1 Tax=Nitrosomonas europaea TaxID=915 RepID=UPI000792CDA5|nr:glucuronyl hydrolase [Nitrosomonas europaea]KXK41309.1 MAG: unsaturated glucuronyl hydrolase [Nitrosomonas europaea]